MRYAHWLVASLGFAVASASSGVAFATYSIAAVDSATQQVGGAVTSCVGSLDLALVYGSVPGSGVVHAQAQLDSRLRGKNRAVQLIEQGVAPSEIIAMITASSLDSGFAARQYGVVDVQGRAAGFTGAQAQAYKKDQQGKVGSFAYSVQGNILTSQRVLDQAATGFEAQACDLAERLMAALEAGGQNGEGDSRCTRSGIPSDAAFIQVDLPGQPAGSWLKLSVSDTAPENPLPKLRAMFDTWRKSHPCTPSAGGAGAGGAAASAGASASAGGAAVSGAAAVGGGGAAGIAAGGAAVGAGAGASAGGVAASGAAAMGGVAASGVGGTATAAVAAGSAAGGSNAKSPESGTGGRIGSTESSVVTAGATGQSASPTAPTCAGASAGACAPEAATPPRARTGCTAAISGSPDPDGERPNRARIRSSTPLLLALGLSLLAVRLRTRRVSRPPPEL